jgi:hypothetical protein
MKVYLSGLLVCFLLLFNIAALAQQKATVVALARNCDYLVIEVYGDVANYVLLEWLYGPLPGLNQGVTGHFMSVGEEIEARHQQGRYRFRAKVLGYSQNRDRIMDIFHERCYPS